MGSQTNNDYGLFELTKKLISFLKMEIEKNYRKKVENPWDAPEIWKAITNNLFGLLSYYRNNDAELGLAEVQVGLAKYLDFYSIKWMSDDDRKTLDDSVTRIVKIARDIIIQSGVGGSDTAVCGMHEDGACVLDPMRSRFLIDTPLRMDRWPSLPEKDAANFKNKPQNILLAQGTRLYRVIGIENTPYGNWWVLDNLPISKKCWRSDCAVLTAWNSDSHYTSFTVDEEMNVWVGAASSQRIPETNCILPGGAEQVWLGPENMQKIPSRLTVQPYL